MSQVDMTRFSDLRPLMQQREQQANLIRMRRQLDPMGGNAILTFWQELSARIQEEEEAVHLKGLLGEIHGDIDMLKALRQTLQNKKGDPQNESKLLQVVRLLMMLLEIADKIKLWHGHILDKNLAYIMSINLASPSKARDKKGMEKDKKKKGQKKAKKAIDQTTEKKKEPSKKMDA
jgi:hypothetical protein